MGISPEPVESVARQAQGRWRPRFPCDDQLTTSDNFYAPRSLRGRPSIQPNLTRDDPVIYGTI